jgi:hypothetical protein
MAPNAEEEDRGELVGAELREGRVRSREDGYARGKGVQTHPCSKLERVSMKSWIATTQLLHQSGRQ